MADVQWMNITIVQKSLDVTDGLLQHPIDSLNCDSTLNQDFLM